MAKGHLIRGMNISVSAVPQPNDLTLAQFEALDYEEVCCPSSAPTFSEEAEIISEFCISGEEQAAVGAASGAETELSVYWKPDCVGQEILRDAFGGDTVLAIRKEYNDSPNPSTTTNTVIYTRVLVTSKGDNDGTVNDLITWTFGLKIAQPPILVLPEAI